MRTSAKIVGCLSVLGVATTLLSVDAHAVGPTVVQRGVVVVPPAARAPAPPPQAVAAANQQDPGTALFCPSGFWWGPSSGDADSSGSATSATCHSLAVCSSTGQPPTTFNASGYPVCAGGALACPKGGSVTLFKNHDPLCEGVAPVLPKCASGYPVVDDFHNSGTSGKDFGSSPAMVCLTPHSPVVSCPTGTSLNPGNNRVCSTPACADGYTPVNTGINAGTGFNPVGPSTCIAPKTNGQCPAGNGGALTETATGCSTGAYHIPAGSGWLYEPSTGTFVVGSLYTCQVGDGQKLPLTSSVRGFPNGVEIGWSAAYAAPDGGSCMTFSGPSSP